MSEQPESFHMGTVVEGTDGWQEAKERLDRLVGDAVKRLGEGVLVMGGLPIYAKFKDAQFGMWTYSTTSQRLYDAFREVLAEEGDQIGEDE